MLKSKLYLGFLAAGLFLSMVLMMEWLHFRSEAFDIKQRLEHQGKTDQPIAGGIPEDLAIPAIAEYAQIIERPLFSETRKPAEMSSAAPETLLLKTPLNLKLMGIVFKPTENMALLVDEKGKYWHVRINNTVSNWKLLAIEKNKVVLQQGSERSELKLDKPRQAKPLQAMPPQLNAQQPQAMPAVDDDDPIVQENNASDEEEEE